MDWEHAMYVRASVRACVVGRLHIHRLAGAQTLCVLPVHVALCAAGRELPARHVSGCYLLLEHPGGGGGKPLGNGGEQGSGMATGTAARASATAAGTGTRRAQGACCATQACSRTV